MTVSTLMYLLVLLISSRCVPPADVGSYTYGVTHAMKPQRMRITHELVSAYDMLPKMHVLVRTLCNLPSGTRR